MTSSTTRQAATASIAVIVTLVLASGAGAAGTSQSAQAPKRVTTASNEDSVYAPAPPRRLEPIVPAIVTTVRRAHAAPALHLLPSVDGISSVAVTAYQHAAKLADAADPSCRVPWQLVAAIGYIESDDGQTGGDSLNAAGDEASPIEGLVLDGTNGVARIVDAQGHAVRAEGPLQFVPSTWAAWKVDANGDGHADPQNIFDASAAAARYLCARGADLSSVAGQGPAITSYNNSPIYVTNVENVERAYLAGRTAGSVTLIPMQGCPKPSATPPAKASAAQPAAAVTPSPAAVAVPAGCPPLPAKKPSKPAPVHIAAARRAAARVPEPASAPKPAAAKTATPKPAPKPTSPVTPTRPVVASPSPSATPTPSLTPSQSPTPTAVPTP